MRRRQIPKTGLAAAALLLVVGCAPLTNAAAPNKTASPIAVSSGQHLGSPSIAPAAQHNRELGSGESERLLKLAEIPSSATRLTQVPARLASSAMGKPGSASMIDRASFWEVPMSQKAAGTWIRQHAPQGLTADFSSPGTGGPAASDIVIGFGFSDHRASPAWTQGVLEISVSVVDSETSAWRVEGEAIWLDPTPAAVENGGARMRVNVAGGCPQSDQGKVGVTNAGAGLGSALIPSGSPSSALVCAYHDGNGTAWGLAAHHILSAQTAQQLAQLVRDTSLSHDTGGTVWSCPADDGAAAVLVFSYPGGSDVDLWLHTSGCPSVDNGQIEAWFTDGVGALRDAVLAARS